MRRDPRAYLWDIQEAAESIFESLRQRSFDDYAQSRQLRSAVEREFEIIGEAINLLCKIDPRWRDLIPDAPHIVAFRNQLIHGYASVDHSRVWITAQESLPALRKAVSALIADLADS